jgi:hypothetical protein
MDLLLSQGVDGGKEHLLNFINEINGAIFVRHNQIIKLAVGCG